MKRGGSRKGAGRKSPDGASRTTRYNVSLDNDTVTKARKIGGGNLSVGLRRAVKAAAP